MNWPAFDESPNNETIERAVSGPPKDEQRENDLWNRNARKLRRQQQWDRANAWLLRLAQERPGIFYTAIAIAGVLIGLLMGAVTVWTGQPPR